MAVTQSTARSVPEEWYHRRPGEPTPRWPAALPDPAAARVSYDEPADELTIFFGGKPVPAVSDPLDAPEGDAYLLVEEGTGAVVGLHVIPLVAGAVPAFPAWRRLAEPDPPPAAVAAFIADVAALAARWGADGPVAGLPTSG